MGILNFGQSFSLFFHHWELKKYRFSRLAIAWFLASLMTVLIIYSPAIASTPKHYTDLTFPPLPEVKLPDYQRYQLDNGLVVYLVEDHALPLISGNIMIKTGSYLEPAEKLGLADITGSVIRSGGTTKHTADELNNLLEERAASIETSIGTNSGGAGFNALSEDLDWVFNLFAEVVQLPAFPQDKIDLEKTQAQGAIARRNDDPEEIGSREFDKLIYGAESPYARTEEYQTLENIKREDLVTFHQTYFRPDAMILGIVGDFEPTKMKALITENFSQWKVSDRPPSYDKPNVTQQAIGGIYLVDQPQAVQSNISVGHLGGTLASPDYPALSVMNGVLNGFGGRLFNEIRSRQGLAYSVYGFWSPQFDHPGTFIAGGPTRSVATVPFIKALRKELAKIQEQPISQEELDYAKDSILNSFVFNFQDPAQTLSRLMRYEYFGYPKDLIFQYQTGVKATTIQDVQRVAKQYLQLDKLVTLVVGNAKEIQPPLTELGGDVQTIDITIPAPPEK